MMIEEVTAMTEKMMVVQRALQAYLDDNNYNSNNHVGDDDDDDATERSWLWAMLWMVTLMFSIIALLFVREFCWWKYDINFFSSEKLLPVLWKHQEEQSTNNHDDDGCRRRREIFSDETTKQTSSSRKEEVGPSRAVSFIRRHSRKISEKFASNRSIKSSPGAALARLDERKKERREWYTLYLKPYSMVLGEEHFKAIDDDNDPLDPLNPKEGHTPKSKSGLPSHSCYLQLPPKDSTNVSCSTDTTRKVENNCSICMTEYEVGETIVWSSLDECQHAYHEECMLLWLCKGKKRCPACRHWFVPAASIHDKVRTYFGESNNMDANPNHAVDIYKDESIPSTSNSSNYSNSSDNGGLVASDDVEIGNICGISQIRPAPPRTPPTKLTPVI